jgi:hypothetical protein
MRKERIQNEEQGKEKSMKWCKKKKRREKAEKRK